MAYLMTSISPTQAIAIEEVSGVTYIGFAKPGADTSNTVWQIRRITESGSATTFELADSNDRYDNKWDDRASLSYG